MSDRRSDYPGQQVPVAAGHRTFAQMVDTKKASLRYVSQRLGMTTRTYLLRRADPSDLSLAEVMRLADWLAEPYADVVAELLAHTKVNPDVLGPGITRPVSKPAPPKEEPNSKKNALSKGRAKEPAKSAKLNTRS